MSPESEFIFQAALADEFLPDFLVPNVHMRQGWEADLLRVTGSGYVHEYEIKVTKGDFNRDVGNSASWAKRTRARIFSVLRAGEGVHREDVLNVANRFWYVAPRGMIGIEDIPDYAGLIEVNADTRRRCVKIIKAAPALHKAKITDNYRRHLANMLGCRYWVGRRNTIAKLYGNGTLLLPGQ